MYSLVVTLLLTVLSFAAARPYHEHGPAQAVLRESADATSLRTNSIPPWTRIASNETFTSIISISVDTDTYSDTAATITTSFDSSNCFSVPNAGVFSFRESYDFTKLDSLPQSLSADEYPIPANDRGSAYSYAQANVVVKQGVSVQLKVPGGQYDNISNGQISTKITDIQYASVRTVAKASAVKGTCHGEPLSTSLRISLISIRNVFLP